MAAAPLTSNHVNYLIWRYLQESGHDRTAARLQRDWKIGDPEKLPFARHIKTHALVSLVQKGLQYHELENSLQQNGERATQTPSALFFGVEPADTAPKDEEFSSSSLRAPPSPSKRSRESVIQSQSHEVSAAGATVASSSLSSLSNKRRRAAKDSNARTTPAKSSDEMEVDPPTSSVVGETVDEQDSSSRHQPGAVVPNGAADDAERENPVAFADASAAASAAAQTATAAMPAVITSTLKAGSTSESQTQHIHQISGSATRMIELGAGKRALKTVWNPRQPNLLASAGDGLCRVWSVPSNNNGSGGGGGSTAGPVTEGAALRATAATSANGLGATESPATVALTHTNLLFDSNGEAVDNATITAIAWSPSGDQLVAARHPNESNEASAVSVFSKDGHQMSQLGKGQRFFFGLAFNQPGTLLLGHGGDNSHYADQSRDFGLCVWDLESDDLGPAVSVSTPSRQEIESAVWLDGNRIIVCGPDYVATTFYHDRSLEPLQELSPELVPTSFEGAGVRSWSYVEYDKRSGTCILSDAYNGLVGLLSADRKRMHTVRAHDQQFETRGVQYQPVPQNASGENADRYVATASSDGSVKLWTIRDEQLHLSRTFYCNAVDPTRQPVLALQFSPDGVTLAVATRSRVVFWRLEKPGAWPYAEWSLERSEIGWRDGSPLVKNEQDGEAPVNGNAPVIVNGINGHSERTDVNGTSTSTGTNPIDDDGADRMNLDTRDIKPIRNELDEQDVSATITWSVMGKKVAYGNGEQILLASASIIDD